MRPSKFLVFILLKSIVVANEVSLCLPESAYGCTCASRADERTKFITLSADCSNRDLNMLDKTMLIPKSTIVLDLSGNLIRDIKYGNPLNSTSLKVLMLNKNRIKTVEDMAFKDLPSLEYLDLSYNKIEALDVDVFSTAYQMIYLDLSHNLLHSFVPKIFMDMQNVLKLNLSDNNIGDFLMSSTKIFDSSDDGLCLNVVLEDLILENVNISTLPENFFSSSYNMRRISLAKNSIQQLPKLPFTLEYLDVSSTPITSLGPSNFTDLPGIKHFIANHMPKLNEIQNDTFKDVYAIEMVSLQDCKSLEELSPRIFSSNVTFSLREINLLGSGLQMLDESWSLILPQLTKLDLRANPWQCNCQIKWLKKINVDKMHKPYIRCYSPKKFIYQSLWSVPDEDLTCPTHLDVVRWLTVNGLILFSVMLVVLAIWLIFLWPPNRPPPTAGPQTQYFNVSIIPNRAEAY